MRFIFQLNILLIVVLLSLSAFADPHILKFEGVPATMAGQLKKDFPQIFSREVDLSEIDAVVRYLMNTKSFSNIEVHERFPTDHPAEYVLVASLLRTIKLVTVDGNTLFNRSHIMEKLKIDNSQVFERKELLANADELQTEYAEEGYLNPQIDIDFETPKESEIIIHVKINEGTPSTITEVNFECPNPDLVVRFKKLAKPLAGNRLSNNKLKDLENDIKDYLARNRYLRAKLSSPNLAFNRDRELVKVNYVIENPTRYEFLFDGNKFFSEGSLVAGMELEKVVGATTSFAPDLADRIRKIYLGAGFSFVQVDYKEKAFEKYFKEQVRFKILEGPRVRIQKLSVDGQISRPEKFYANFIRDNSSDIISLGYYNRKDFETGQKNLITQLQNDGFLKSKITATRTEYSKSKEFSQTTISIDEGPQTFIKTLRFRGNTSIPSSQLLAQISVKPGSAFKQKELEDSIKTLKEYYRSLGYLEMRLINEGERLVTFNANNTEANLDFLVQEGPKIVVGSIEIQGLSLTKKYVVERELGFKPGDILTPKNIDESSYRLQKLQLFSNVQIKTVEEGTNISNRTVLVTIAEHDPGLVNSGVGLNNEFQLTYKGFAGIGYKNLWGTGRGVSARADAWYPQDPSVSYLENRETIGYLEPWMFGERITGRVNLSIQDQYSNQVNSPTGTAVVIEEQRNAELLLEKEITRHFKFTFYVYEFSRIKDFFLNEYDPALLGTSNPALPGGTFYGNKISLLVDIAKVGPMFELDYRDDIFNPSRGTYTRTQLFYADPKLGSSDDSGQFVQFFQGTGSVTNYLRLTQSKRYVWVNQARGDYIGNISHMAQSGFPSAIGPSLGGATTIRGFDVTEKIPNVYDLGKGVIDISSFKYTVETYDYLYKSEVRFPLMTVSGLEVGGAFFYDVGGVFVNQSGASNPDTFRDSAGFGIRISTPVGPVNADLAFKLNPRSRLTQYAGVLQPESPYAFHFTVGNF